MKKCSQCFETKLLTEFSKQSRNPDGLRYYCKSCGSNYTAQYRKVNPEKSAAAVEKWKTENPGKSKQSVDNWRKNNADRIKQNSKQYYAENSERIKIRNRNQHFVKNYNLTIDQVENLKKLQDHKCATCFSDLITEAKPNVDHNHATGKVRGILCMSCNVTLGLVKENLTTLENMIRYLNHHN